MNARNELLTYRQLTLVLASLVVGFTIAAHGPAPAADAVRPDSQRPYFAADFSLPGVYWMLSRQAVREEIGITAEQTEKLKDIGRRFAEANRQSTAGVDWATLTPDARREKYAQMLAENKKRTDAFIQQVEGVLTAEQKSTFEKIELRQQAVSLLLYAPTAEKLGLSDQQKEKLRVNREEYQKKMNELQGQIQKLHDQAGQAALELLTPEQIQKLKDVRRFGLSGVGGAAASEKK